MQLFHHGSCLIGSWACWSSGRSGADVTFALFVAELANPFMYLRYLLRELGWKDTKLARTNQVRRGKGMEKMEERVYSSRLRFSSSCTRHYFLNGVRLGTNLPASLSLPSPRPSSLSL